MIVHHLGVAVEKGFELVAHFGRGATLHDKVLTAGNFRGFAEQGSGPRLPELVKSVTHCGIGSYTGSGVRFSALGGDPEFVDPAFHALQFCGIVNKFLGRARSFANGGQIAVLFDGETGHRFACRGDAVYNALRPLRFNADDHHSRHVGIAARADQGAEMQFQIFAELQTAVSVG